MNVPATQQLNPLMQITFPQRDIAAGWQWRSKDGRFTRPEDMETRHLFHTLRMIWNNTMLAAMRVGNVRLYHFGPHYTTTYLADAVCYIGNELLARPDMTPEQRAQIDQMARHIWSAAGMRIAAV